MIRTIEAGEAFFIEACDPRVLDEKLNAAEDAAIQQAMLEGR